MKELRNIILFFFLEILKAIDNWRKVFALFLLLMFSGIMSGGYFMREDIQRWIVTRIMFQELLTNDMSELTRRVILATGAEVVTIWAVELTDNYRHAVFSRSVKNEAQNISNKDDLLFSSIPGKSELIVLLIEKNVVCYERVKYPSVDFLITNEPMTYVCLVAVPPNYGTMLGIIAIGFNVAPENTDLIKKKLLAVARVSLKGSKD